MARSSGNTPDKAFDFPNLRTFREPGGSMPARGALRFGIGDRARDYRDMSRWHVARSRARMRTSGSFRLVRPNRTRRTGGRAGTAASRLVELAYCGEKGTCLDR